MASCQRPCSKARSAGSAMAFPSSACWARIWTETASNTPANSATGTRSRLDAIVRLRGVRMVPSAQASAQVVWTRHGSSAPIPRDAARLASGIDMGLFRRLMPLGLSAVAVCVVLVGANPQDASAAPAPPKSLRLYVFDCGLINVNRAGTERYNVTPEEVGETRFVVPCFLVAHPRGTLMWDLGVV